MWTFHQDTGREFDENGILQARGYAGRNAGKNNPAMEGVKGIGPLPRGRYRGVELFEVHPTVGKYAIRLEPDAETRARIIAYGRNPDSFFNHGDSSEHPGLASHGCIVTYKPARVKFWTTTDRWIEVV